MFTKTLVAFSILKSVRSDVSLTNATVATSTGGDRESATEAMTMGDETDTRLLLRYTQYEAIRPLKLSLLNQKRIPVSDDRLVIIDHIWLIQHGSHKLYKIDMLGMCAQMNTVYTWARSEDGRWCKFQRPPKEFIGYLSILPLLYESNNLICDGKYWYAINRFSEYRKVLRTRYVNDLQVRFQTDDGHYYNLSKDPQMLRFTQYLLKLPKSYYTCPFNVTSNKTNLQVLRRYLPPTHALRDAILRWRTIPESSNNLRYLMGRWYILFQARALKIDTQGFGRDSDSVLLHTDNGAWHKCSNIPLMLKHHLRKVRKQYDFGRIVFDGAHWYAQNDFHEFKRVVRRGNIEKWIIVAQCDDQNFVHFKRDPAIDVFVAYLRTLPEAIYSAKNRFAMSSEWTTRSGVKVTPSTEPAIVIKPATNHTEYATAETPTGTTLAKSQHKGGVTQSNDRSTDGIVREAMDKTNSHRRIWRHCKHTLKTLYNSVIKRLLNKNSET